MRVQVALVALLLAALATVTFAKDYQRLTEVPCKFQHVLSIDNIGNITTIELDYREKVIPALAFALTSEAQSHFVFTARLKDCSSPSRQPWHKTFRFGQNANATWRYHQEHKNYSFSVNAKGKRTELKWTAGDTATFTYETTVQFAWVRTNSTQERNWASSPLMIEAERHDEVTLYKPKFRADRSNGCEVEITVHNITLWIPVELVPKTTTTTQSATPTARTPTTQSTGSVILPTTSALLLLILALAL